MIWCVHRHRGLRLATLEPGRMMRSVWISLYQDDDFDKMENCGIDEIRIPPPAMIIVETNRCFFVPYRRLRDQWKRNVVAVVAGWAVVISDGCVSRASLPASALSSSIIIFWWWLGVMAAVAGNGVSLTKPINSFSGRIFLMSWHVFRHGMTSIASIIDHPSSHAADPNPKTMNDSCLLKRKRTPSQPSICRLTRMSRNRHKQTKHKNKRKFIFQIHH